MHRDLHWDIDTAEAAWPVPLAVQGVVYLEDTPKELGALRVVPGAEGASRWKEEREIYEIYEEN